MASEEFKKVEQALNSFGTKLVKDVQKSLKAKGHVPTSGQSGLFGSVRYNVVIKGNTVIMNFFMAKYGDYIDEGTRKASKKGTGGDKMERSIESWIQQRPELRTVVQQVQKSYKDKDGKLHKRKNPLSYKAAKESLAFGIKRAIHKKGIIKRFGYKGSKFYTNVIKDGRMQRLQSFISKQMGEDIKLIIGNESKLLQKGL